MRAEILRYDGKNLRPVSVLNHAPSPYNARIPTVFVVDDDRAMRDSLRWLIESVQHKVRTFENAREFLASSALQQPGCLVLDVRMPGMSGMELQQTLQNRGVNIPIIIVTGHGDIPMAVRAMKAGALDFLPKPFNEQILLDCIEHALNQDADHREQRQQTHTIQARYATLTPRERQVMDKVVAGQANKVIAYDLGVSMKTVEAHRGKLMRKMHARTLSTLVKMSQLIHETEQ